MSICTATASGQSHVNSIYDFSIGQWKCTRSHRFPNLWSLLGNFYDRCNSPITAWFFVFPYRQMCYNESNFWQSQAFMLGSMLLTLVAMVNLWMCNYPQKLDSWLRWISNWQTGHHLCDNMDQKRQKRKEFFCHVPQKTVWWPIQSTSGDWSDKNQQTTAQIASEYGVHPNQVSQWKKQVLEQLPQLLTNGRSKATSDTDQLVDELYRQIGQLKVELDWLQRKTQLLRWTEATACRTRVPFTVGCLAMWIAGFN